ncbi:hypothetical protein SNEBB_004571 [Seison nebaliae]|nr:hypothetical protein SNEBB_004571 [Seison nebaliae]
MIRVNKILNFFFLFLLGESYLVYDNDISSSFTVHSYNGNKYYYDSYGWKKTLSTQTVFEVILIPSSGEVSIAGTKYLLHVFDHSVTVFALNFDSDDSNTKLRRKFTPQYLLEKEIIQLKTSCVTLPYGNSGRYKESWCTRDLCFAISTWIYGLATWDEAVDNYFKASPRQVDAVKGEIFERFQLLSNKLLMRRVVRLLNNGYIHGHLRSDNVWLSKTSTNKPLIIMNEWFLSLQTKRGTSNTFKLRTADLCSAFSIVLFNNAPANSFEIMTNILRRLLANIKSLSEEESFLTKQQYEMRLFHLARFTVSALVCGAVSLDDETGTSRLGWYEHIIHLFSFFGIM